MVGPLLLKQMFNQGDETVVGRLGAEPLLAILLRMNKFQWQAPCDPSDLVYFRERIGGGA
jgi:transposase, IS5 family